MPNTTRELEPGQCAGCCACIDFEGHHELGHKIIAFREAKINEEWEIEFNKKWKYTLGTVTRENAIKEFIRRLLVVKDTEHAEEMGRIRLEVEEMKYRNVPTPDGDLSDWSPEMTRAYAYNSALSDVLALLGK